MTLPWPKFAHGDRVISAKPRGAAQFLSDLHMRHVGDRLTGWGGWIRTSAFQNRNSPRLSAWAAGFEPLHIEII